MIQPILLLTSLTRLCLGPCDSVWELSQLSIVIEWHKLQALQHLSMRHSDVQLDDLAGLLQLQHVRTISLYKCTINGEDFAEFICHQDLARLRPHVKLSLDDLIVMRQGI